MNIFIGMSKIRYLDFECRDSKSIYFEVEFKNQKYILLIYRKKYNCYENRELYYTVG